MKRIGFLFYLIIGWSLSLYGTHNRAGEITYRQIDALTIEITITTYTKTSSQSADRDSLLVFWGYGSSQLVGRVNGDGDLLENDVKKNLYVARHTYPGRGTYTVSFTDPNRVGTILNVNYPNSIDVPFYLGTTFTLLDPQFQGTNNSAILLQAPVDKACVGKVFTHNPNAYDADGDSLSYQLVPPQMAVGEDVPGYRYPDEIGMGENNKLTIDPLTGMIRWDSPQIQGEYNIAIKIKEWRKGVLLNEIIRDMQILVLACENDPPVIETIQELCVTAGDKIDIPIRIDDINIDQKVLLEYTGGPFQLEESPASVSNANQYTPVAYEARLKWHTTCDHISSQDYQIVLKAIDDAFSETDGLSTLHTIRIKVVGPKPLDVRAENRKGEVKVSWESPYLCDNRQTDKFQGFSVWRKKGVFSGVEDSCTIGIKDAGYEKIVFITKEEENNRYFYIDKFENEGSTYCYKILGEFASLTTTGNPYNRSESRPSDEACIRVSRELPLITKVSVANTDAANGRIDVHWARPLKDQIDTQEYPPPYTFEFIRWEENLSQLLSDYTVTIDDLSQNIDTSFLDVGINTEGKPYSYQVRMKSGSKEIGTTSKASSIYTTATPGDNQVRLSWKEDVPWSNSYYDIYKIEGLDTIFIDSTVTSNYLHTRLVNNVEVCYLIRSTGKYGIDNINEPLVNDSQVTCATPQDNTPPCAPTLDLINTCSDTQEASKLKDTENILHFGIDNTNCNNPEDVVRYNIYYKQPEEDTYTLIGSSEKTSFLHDQEASQVGCYTVTALDDNGNESELSKAFCTIRCPEYRLPNTFTPNDDGYNDILRPIVNKHIASIEFTLFNTWGNILYKSALPELEWKGVDSRGNNIEDGVYYYTCIINYDGPDKDGKTSDSMSGYIQIFR